MPFVVCSEGVRVKCQRRLFLEPLENFPEALLTVPTCCKVWPKDDSESRIEEAPKWSPADVHLEVRYSRVSQSKRYSALQRMGNDIERGAW